MKLIRHTATEVEIDLQSLPFNEWPEDAKELAYAVLAGQRAHDQYNEQLPELRKSWLIARMEARQTTIADLL